MEERRRSIRTELHAELLMNRLGTQTEEKIIIQICDLSKSGMGFICEGQLEMGAVYECSLTIWTKEVIQVFVKIVRAEELENGFRYGGLFVGMNDLDAYRIQVYQTVDEYKQ